MDIIDAIYDIVALVKLQAAYYEMYGYHGMKALYKTCRYAKEKGLFVIMDCKRTISAQLLQPILAHISNDKNREKA
jgi:orotidine-5'-phosphate decarboxylase